MHTLILKRVQDNYNTWIIGASTKGLECGVPSSNMSNPWESRTFNASTVVIRLESPAVVYGFTQACSLKKQYLIENLACLTTANTWSQMICNWNYYFMIQWNEYIWFHNLGRCQNMQYRTLAITWDNLKSYALEDGMELEQCFVKLAKQWQITSSHQYPKWNTVSSLQPHTLSFYFIGYLICALESMKSLTHCILWREELPFELEVIGQQQDHNLRPKTINDHQKLPKEPYKIPVHGKWIIILLKSG